MAKSRDPGLDKSYSEQRRKLNTHVLRKIFAQVSKTRRIPDRSGKDRRCTSVSQSQASYWCRQIFRVKRSTFKSLWNYCQRKYRSFGSLLLNELGAHRIICWLRLTSWCLKQESRSWTWRAERRNLAFAVLECQWTELYQETTVTTPD